MSTRTWRSWIGIALLLGVLLVSCGLAGDHPLLELWRPVP